MSTTLVSPESTDALAADGSPELAALLTKVGVAPHDQTGWIRVTGEDRVRWLNGMVTNSIQALQPGEGCYNFVLNAQGRIQGDLTAFAASEALLLQTGRGQIGALIPLLDHYIIMDDVALADVSAEQLGVSVAGPGAPALIEKIGLPATSSEPVRMSVTDWRGEDAEVRIVHQHSPLVPRFELWSKPEVIDALHSALTEAGATECGPEAFEQLRILEGTPRYGTDIRNSETARDLPQETGQTRALHFTKGCYLGQEIVERIRSRGNVHRTFGGFELKGLPAAAGTALTSDGKAVGEITSSASIPLPGRVVQLALGYIRREALDRGLPITYAGGSAISVPLPYSLT